MSIPTWDLYEEYTAGSLVKAGKYTYFARRHAMPYIDEPNGDYPAPAYLLPDDPRYARYIENRTWVQIVPEWEGGTEYEINDQVQYNGKFFMLSSRAFARLDLATKQTNNQPINVSSIPPDEQEDEDGYRVWVSSWQNQRASSFPLMPYNLERFFGSTPGSYNQSLDNEASQKKSPHPYGSQTYNSEEMNGWRRGVGTQERRNGFSLEVYQNYEDETFVPTPPPLEGPPDPEVEPPPPPDPVVYREGGPTGAQWCGVAFQSPQAQYIHSEVTNTSYSYYSPPFDLTYPPYPLFSVSANGLIKGRPEDDMSLPTPDIPASPDESFKYRVHFSHNHPLYFRRQVFCSFVLKTALYQWVKKVVRVNVEGLPPYSYTTHDLVVEYLKKRKSRQFIPNDDCFMIETAFGYYEYKNYVAAWFFSDIVNTAYQYGASLNDSYGVGLPVPVQIEPND